jgi:hypothetical protein
MENISRVSCRGKKKEGNKLGVEGRKKERKKERNKKKRTKDR